MRINRPTSSGSSGGGGGGSTTTGPMGIPSYAGTRTRPHEPAISVYGRSADNTRTLRARLGAAAVATGLARVLFVGDSTTAGYAVTPGRNDAVTLLRDALERDGYRVGSFVFARNNTTTDARWNWGGWAAAPTMDLPYITGGSSATATFTSDVAGTVVEILTTSESARFQYSIDGASAVTISAAGASNQMQLITITGLADTVHTITFTAAASGQSSIVGAGVRPAAGVVLANAGMTSSRTQDWIGDWYQGLGATLGWQPHVVHIELGGNDAINSVTAATFATQLGTLVDACQDYGAEVYLTGSHHANPTSVPSWDTYLTKIYDVSDTYGVPLLDEGDRFGTYAQISALGLLSGDNLHYSEQGYGAKARAWADLFGITYDGRPVATALDAVRVYALGTSQVLTSGAPDAINITNIEFNDAPLLYTVDLAGNTITVNQSGKYLVQWELKFDGGTSGQRYASFARPSDFTTFRESGFIGTSGATSGASPVKLTAGDAVALYGYADGGTNVGVASDVPRATGFCLIYLGP